MKRLFVFLIAILLGASLAFGQNDSSNSSKISGGNVDGGSSDNLTDKSKIQLLAQPAASENSVVAARAVELNNNGVRLSSKGDYRNAVESFRQAAALAPDNNQILLNLGTALFKSRREEAAVEIFKKVIETAAPASQPAADAYAGLAQALNNGGKSEESFSAYSRSLEISPNDAIVLCNFANALQNAGRGGDESEALEIVNRALKFAPGNSVVAAAAYNIRGSILFNLKKYREARSDFELAAKLNPALADPINNLGVIFSREGNKKKALQYFLEAARLAPDWEEVEYNLALNYSEIGNREKSREYQLKLENSNSALDDELKRALLRKYVVDVSEKK